MFSHLNITLFGNVQGVFLRRTIKHEAGRRGIFGFVRNDADGTVHIEAEGDPEVLKNFISWLKQGGGEGDYQIKEVESEEGTFQGFQEFVVKE